MKISPVSAFAIAMVTAVAVSMPAFAQKGGILANQAARDEATDMYEQAKASPAPQDPYMQSLHRNYLQLADFEQNRMEDFFSSMFYSARVLEISNGGDIVPETVDDREIDPEFHAELQADRERLMSALDGGARDALPDAAGHATALYDCWLEQQEEGHQPDDINNCRTGFLREMQNLERALAARDAVADTTELVSLDADVLFDFDSAAIKDEAAETMKMAADAVRQAGDSQIVVVGHTDSTGDALYNMELGQRRADAIHEYLVFLGVDEAEIMTVSFGETQPIASNLTPEGRSENRRVVVRATN